MSELAFVALVAFSSRREEFAGPPVLWMLTPVLGIPANVVGGEVVVAA